MKKLFRAVALLVMIGCTASEPATLPPDPYMRWVGDSEFDPALDDQQFAPCHGEEHVGQYFNYSKGLQYEGEKLAILEAFKQGYTPIRKADQSGLLRIRFVVNCKGESGRFRLLGMDQAYQEKVFDTAITDQLLQITRSLKGWKTQLHHNVAQDYYQYLIVKLDKGEIKEILP